VGKVAAGLAAAIALLLALACGGAFAFLVPFLSGATLDPSAGAAFGCGAQVVGNLPPGHTLGDLDNEQLGNAKVIVQTGATLKVPTRGLVVAVATAMQESTLHNYDHGDRDSVGLFQQRPSQGWGTRAQVMDPVYSSTQFYRHLVKVDGWQRMPLTVAAQAVQRSAFPDAYAKWESLATQVVEASGGQAAACAPAGQVSAGGWTMPADGPVGSGFGPRGGGFHAGVDIIVPPGTTVRAAHAGIVTVVLCNASGGSGPQDRCEAPGGTYVSGCGWYVEVDHGGGVMTRYCHATRVTTVVGQRVQAGDPLMLSGSTGNSSGPHLHFEVHVGGGDNASAVDPVTWLRAHGVTVGNPT
jgi:murein DD-endopeptidase MepM/ murein hydrolase activator NlpD